MHDIDLILTLTGSLAAALVCGYATFRLGLSPIVGYLLAGVIVGPNTPGFVANSHLAEQLAEIGVILLMFGVGLQFHLEELLAVRKVAIPGALGQILIATTLGILIGVLYGWQWSTSLVFGLAISVASTVVLLRVLADHGDLHTPAGHIAVGWLVVEDLFTVLVLVLLPAVFSRGNAGAGAIALAIAVAAVKLAVMVGLTFLVGERIIPRLLDRVAATRSRELFTLMVLVLALGIAVGSALLFGVSMALGAFLAGMVVGRSEFSLRAATEALPMRDAFAVLFFVSVGILFDPRQLAASPGLTAVTLAAIVVGKPLAALVIMLVLKHPLRVAVPVAAALAQIGEFSFILAAAGKHLGLLDAKVTNTLIAASVFSITANPILYRLVRPSDGKIGRFLKKAESPSTLPREGPADAVDRHRAIVVGYGPVGRTLARLLKDDRFEPVIIELNLDTVRELGRRGMRAVYGDATHADTLRQAGLEGAVCLILSSANMEGGREAIRLARELNPRILIFARSSYLDDLPALREAGAEFVFSGEGEVALAMTEALMRRLGATPEQLDRERDRIRRDLLQGAQVAEIPPPPEPGLHAS